MPERRSSFCYSRGLAACCCIGGQRRHHFDRQPRRRQVDPLVRSLATYDRSDQFDPLATPSRNDCYLRTPAIQTFTAADVLYAGALPLLGEKKTEALEDYVARCVSRPARARAAAKDQNPV
jgi:hypothetical protein